MTSKKAIRKEIAQLVKAMDPQEKKVSDAKILHQVLGHPLFQEAKVLFCFVSTEREINTHPIIQEALAQKKIVCVPKCFAYGVMKAYAIQSMDDLEPGKYGILEPKMETEITPEKIDLAIIPCCAATTDGKRLGYGGGFYDRYLANTSFKKMVLCRQICMKADLPTEATDIKMDLLVQEDACFPIKNHT